MRDAGAAVEVVTVAGILAASVPRPGVARGTVVYAAVDCFAEAGPGLAPDAGADAVDGCADLGGAAAVAAAVVGAVAVVVGAVAVVVAVDVAAAGCGCGGCCGGYCSEEISGVPRWPAETGWAFATRDGASARDCPTSCRCSDPNHRTTDSAFGGCCSSANCFPDGTAD